MRSNFKSSRYSAILPGSMMAICARPLLRMLASDLFMNWHETPTRSGASRCTMLTAVTFGSPSAELVAR
jgi:hypothetical protein